MEIIFILLIALALDLAFGEPSNTRHPIAWLGKLISLEMKLAPQTGKVSQLAYGAIMVFVTLGLIILPIYFLLAYLKEINPVIYIVVAGLLLKYSFSLRGLRQAVNAVKRSLARNNLAAARTSLKALVSRDTANLSQSQMISATVESAAENSSDSFVAPIFYFLIFGVPGAIAYRIINTFDAMVGYHGKFEYLGKFAARLDDAVNFLPARITGIIIVLAALMCKKNMSQAWHIMLRDHKRTESPNAGWTMSAIAGALGIQLEKVGHYKLGDNHNPLSLDTINASQQMMITVAIIWSLVFILAEVIYFAAT
ncbi:MAG: cobalamin biosynthesis protein [Chloroflexi bacterium]|nr:cobalamin biosynthesis protein [Chloroflexota bacterium]